MRPLTDTTPKPLLRVGGQPLLDYHIQALARGGISDLVINLAWHGDQIRQHVGDGSGYGLRVAYSDEGPEALETGGGIQLALPLLGDAPFWLVNGDIYCEFTFGARGLARGTLGHLVLVPNPPHNLAGDFSLSGHQVGPPGPDSLTYSGIAVLDPALFRDVAAGRFPLAPLLVRAAEAGALTGERFDGIWLDVGTPERLVELDRLL